MKKQHDILHDNKLVIICASLQLQSLPIAKEEMYYLIPVNEYVI